MGIERPDRTLATLLRQFRLAAGLTQEALAERARLSGRGIADLERGVRRAPRRETVQLLAEALALSPAERSAFEAAARIGAPVEATRGPTAMPPTSAGPELPLVGRSRERILLEQHLAAEGPPVLLLAGEPGIGKSRLLHEARRQAVEQGLTVLAGGCQRRGGQESYAPVLEALEHYLQVQEPVHLRSMLRGCAWLVRLLPELAELGIEPLPAWSLPPDQEQRLLFKAVGHFLRNVAGPAGTLLVLDDLQWAGAEALDLLAALVRANPEASLRVIGAYRETEVPPHAPLAGLLDDLAQAGLGRRLSLGPLSAAEAADLLAGLLVGQEPAADALQTRILQRAGGVPFFLVSCAQAARLRTDAMSDAVPWDVAHSVRRRVTALSQETHELLGMAAVMGRLVPIGLLVAVAARPEDEVLSAIDAACRGRLLEEVPGEHAYRFAHDVIREVIEADLGLARRAVLHRQIGAALEQMASQPPAEEVAYHYAQTPDDERAAYWLERAGDRAAVVYSMETALGHYRAARERLVAAGDTAGALAGLDEKVGTALVALGRYDESLAALEAATERYRAAQDLEGVRRTLARITEAYVHTAANPAGLARLLPLLAGLESVQATPGLAALYVGLADLYSWMPNEQLETVARAEDLARAVGEGRLLAAALERRAEALLKLDRLEEALPVAREACAAAEAAGDIEQLWRALDDVARIHSALGDIDVGRAYFERALSAAEQSGNPLALAHVLHNQGWVAASYEGDWDRATALWERAVAVNRQAAPHGWSVHPALLLGHLTLLRGEREAGLGYLEEGLSLAQPHTTLWAQRWAGWIQAEQEIRDGDPAAARDRLVPLLDRPGAEEGEELQVAHLLPTLALAFLELGEVTEAAECARESVRRLRAAAAHNSRAYPGERIALVDAQRVQALVMVRQGRVAEARATLEDALSLSRRLRYPYGEARVLHAYGQISAEHGDPSRAPAQMEAALAIFERLGARPDSERVEQDLSAL